MQQPTTRRPKVCVLEDDPAVSDSLRISLERNGYDVTDFDGAGAFLANGRPDSYDCLIVDHRLPLLSGLELVELLRARAYSKPALLIWAHPEAHLLPRIRRAAISETLLKPLAPDHLVAAVERAIHCPGEGLRT
jgi:two-component system response regulator DctR